MMLVDDFIKDDYTQTETTVNIDGAEFTGWQIAKPLNYEVPYFSLEERKKMASLIMQGKAIAVQYFSDLTKEDQVEYVKQKIELAKRKLEDPGPSLTPNPKSDGKRIT